MSLSLGVLSVAAFYITAFVISALLGEALPLLSQGARRLPFKKRSRFWLTIALLPSLFGAALVAVTLMPASEAGGHHCLSHLTHHPHLCLAHPAATPGIALLGLSLLALGRVVHALWLFAKRAHINSTAGRALNLASDRVGDLNLLPTEIPQGFVTGVFHPRIHVSEGLMALGDSVVGPVVAHERAHIENRDPFIRAVFPLLSLGHLPSVGRAIFAELTLSQELAADQKAVQEVGDPLLVADALLTMARVTSGSPAVVGFSDGDIKTRIEALLAPCEPKSVWPVSLLFGIALGACALFLTFHEQIHHAVESILGALS